jgi:SAM-dependent methyltransferase
MNGSPTDGVSGEPPRGAVARDGGPTSTAALRIFLYNWPTYLVTWSLALVAMGAAFKLPFLYAFVVASGGAIALTWSLASLAVSTYVYDRSPLVAGRWLLGEALVPARVTEWATVHAGLDAEVNSAAALPGRCVARLLTPHADDAVDRPSTAQALSLADDSCDTVIVAFTAHEIRDRRVRELFFLELRRILRTGGRVVLVEHLRDFPNFAAFGPGFFHFLARSEWLRLAAHAELTPVAEVRITPWVMALALEKSPRGAQS